MYDKIIHVNLNASQESGGLHRVVAFTVNVIVKTFILLHEKLLQINWLTAVVFQLDLNT